MPQCVSTSQPHSFVAIRSVQRDQCQRNLEKMVYLSFSTCREAPVEQEMLT